MRHIKTVAIAISIGVLGLASASHAATAKRTYCSNQDYYTDSGANAGGTYPHLHCGNNWITYSKNSGQHYNFYVGDSVVESKANNACTQADAQDADNLKAKIRTICDDDSKTCNDCN